MTGIGTTASADGHECPAPGCLAPVPRTQLACRKDWARVDKRTQQRVYRAYRNNDIGEHLAAITDAIDQIVKAVEAEQAAAASAVQQPDEAFVADSITAADRRLSQRLDPEGRDR